MSDISGLTPLRIVPTAPADATYIGDIKFGEGLPANSGVDIGDVDVLSCALPTGASTSANQTTLIGHVDGIEGLLTTIDTDTSNMDTSLNNIETAVQLLDDSVFTGGSAAASATDKGLAIVAIVDPLDYPAYDQGDYGQLTLTGTGRLKAQSMLTAPDDATYIGDIKFGESLPAGTNNIGDVDVLSCALPTGASTSANQTTIIGHVDGIEGLLTTIDTDTGAMDTKLGNIVTAVQLIDDAISGTEMQVDVVTLPVGEAAGDPLFAQLTDGTNVISSSNPLPVITQGSAGTMNSNQYETSAALAAGGAIDLDSDTFGIGVVAALIEVSVSSSVPLRVRLYSVIDSAESGAPFRTFFTSVANPTLIYRPANDEVIRATGGSTTTNSFRLEVTNMDTTSAADVYGHIAFANLG